jgi:hypothetical protein
MRNELMMASPEPDVLSALLGNPEQAVRMQAVELFRTLRSPEDSSRAALIATALDSEAPLAVAVALLWPDQVEPREALLRSFALDCAMRVLPALQIYRRRPWPGFAGRIPDLSVVAPALSAARDREQAAMVTANRAMVPAISACRRWSRAAVDRGGPSRALRCALEALRAVRHTCNSSALDAARHTGWSAQRAAASAAAEADWQRGWLVERLLGASPLLVVEGCERL